VPNPLYSNIENSRRFRALPLFASLLSLGKEGYSGEHSGLPPACSRFHRMSPRSMTHLGLSVLPPPPQLPSLRPDIFRRNNKFAQQVAHYITSSPSYTLLNPSSAMSDPIVPLNIVLFSGSEDSQFPPSDPASSVKLAEAINATRRIYVTGTKWRGSGAIRLAVSNWRTGIDGDEDLKEVVRVLDEVAQ